MSSPDREAALRWALFLPVPFAPPVLWAAVPAHQVSAILAGWVAMIAAAIACARPAGLDRKEAGTLAGLAAAATALAGSFWVYLAFITFCGSSSVDALAAVAAGILTHLVFAGAVLRSDEPTSRVLGMPTAVVAGFAVSAIALGILAAGPHSCPN